MNKQTQPIQMEPQLAIMTPPQLRALVNTAVKDALAEAETRRKAALLKDQEPELLSRQQAADLLGVSVGTIDNYGRDGLLDKRKIGAHTVRYERAQIEKLARRV